MKTEVRYFAWRMVAAFFASEACGLLLIGLLVTVLSDNPVPDPGGFGYLFEVTTVIFLVSALPCLAFSAVCATIARSVRLVKSVLIATVIALGMFWVWSFLFPPGEMSHDIRPWFLTIGGVSGAAGMTAACGCQIFWNKMEAGPALRVKYAERIMIASVTAIVFVIAAYVTGVHAGQKEYAKHLVLTRHYLEQVAELDRSFLMTLQTHPNTMRSGTYTLETKFPGYPAEVHEMKLIFENGQLLQKNQTISPTLITGGFTQEGQIVSGSVNDMDKGPNREYTGVIDGDRMWGQVYMPPGQGWHEGEPARIGVWKLYPKSQE